jgi:hypothetical protein
VGATRQTIGIFNPTTFTFHIVPVHFKKAIPDVYDYELNKDSRGNVYLIVAGYNWFYFNAASFSMEEDAAPFNISDTFEVRKVVDDPGKMGVTWIAVDTAWRCTTGEPSTIHAQQQSGAHPLLADSRFSRFVTNFYIDSKRRHWIVYWEVAPKKTTQYCYCFDEKTGVIPPIPPE